MAVVTVKKPRKSTAKRHPHVTVVSAAGSVTLGTTDEEVAYSGLGSTWVEVDRPGTTALARRAKRNRMRAVATAMLIEGFNGQSVEQQMLTLDKICASSATCGVSYAEMAGHRWNLIEVSSKTIDRRPMTNVVKHADVTLTFLVDIDERLTTAVSRKSKPGSDKGSSSKRKTTTVRKGETLSKIAARVYGNANRAGELAKLNKIRNPKSIKVGQKIKY